MYEGIPVVMVLDVWPHYPHICPPGVQAGSHWYSSSQVGKEVYPIILTCPLILSES